MLTRILTGLVLAPVVVAAAWFFPDTAGVGLAVLATGLAVREYLDLSQVKGIPALKWFLVAWTMLLPLLARVSPDWWVPCLLASPIICLVAFLLMPSRIPTAFAQSAAAGMGVLYLGVLMSSVTMLASLPGRGGPGLLTLFAVVWLGDSFAYFGGKTLGRHQLYPAVSPKKTWEGALFGLAGSVGGAFLIDALAGTGLTWVSLLLVGLLGGVSEQVGDLAESVLKRSVGVKDSANLLPGHGGMLDRIDGLLFAAPIVWAFFA